MQPVGPDGIESHDALSWLDDRRGRLGARARVGAAIAERRQSGDLVFLPSA